MSATNLSDWEWLIRPPWWRPFKRRAYDREIASGIGYYYARFKYYPRPSGWALSGVSILYRRPTLWQRLKWKLTWAPKSPSNKETK